MYIKVYVSSQEKEQLDKIADAKGIALSRLCYEQITPLIHNPVMNVEKMESGDSETRDEIITLHLSKEEYAFLQKNASGMPLSRYIRNMLLYKYEPIKIQVSTDDISILTMKVSGYMELLHRFIAGLAVRQQLHQADYDKLMQIASDTQKAIRDAANYAKANRTSIRNTGVRILRAEIKKAVEKQFSSGKGAK